MMESLRIKSPRSQGRSRFSKALPTLPSVTLDTSSFGSSFDINFDHSSPQPPAASSVPTPSRLPALPPTPAPVPTRTRIPALPSTPAPVPTPTAIPTPVLATLFSLAPAPPPKTTAAIPSPPPLPTPRSASVLTPGLPSRPNQLQPPIQQQQQQAQEQPPQQQCFEASPPPPKNLDPDVAKPLDSPLPPLPLATPNKMSIPRKPLGTVGLPTSPLPQRKMPSVAGLQQIFEKKGQQSPVASPQQQKKVPLQAQQPRQEQPRQALTSQNLAPVPQHANLVPKDVDSGGAPSPAYSFSSLLSAYTATSPAKTDNSDNGNGSGSGATSTRESETSGSPMQNGVQTASPAAGQSDVTQTKQEQPQPQSQSLVTFPPRKESRSYQSNSNTIINKISSDSNNPNISIDANPTGASSPFVPGRRDKSLPPPPPRADSPPVQPRSSPVEREKPGPKPDQSDYSQQPQASRYTAAPAPAPAPAPVLAAPVAAPAPAADVQHQQQQPGPTPTTAPPATHSTSPSVSSSLLGSNAASSSSSSPPREELWRRRSLKSDKNLVLPVLKLDTITNGSTAPTPALIDQPRDIAGAPTQLPRSSNALPGRNVRPIATRPAPAPPVQHIAPDSKEEEMGQKASRMHKKSLGSGEKAPVSPSTTSTAYTKSHPSPNKAIHPNVTLAARPPTPEYQRPDVPAKVIETVLSPASPASSPEPNPNSRRQQRISRRPVGNSARATDPTAVRPAKSTPILAVSSPTSPPVYSADDAVPPTPAARRAAHPTRVDTGQNAERPTFQQQQQPQQQRQRQQQQQQQQRQPSSPQWQRQPRNPRTQPEGKALTPHMAVVMAAVHGQPMPESSISVGSSTSPTLQHHTSGPIDPSTVVDSTPLTIVHYQCFKQHKHFRQSPNVNYPLSCQTCHKRDAEMRWRCNWCSLRICKGCLDSLAAANNDLDVLLEKLDQMKKRIAKLEGEEEFAGAGFDSQTRATERHSFIDANRAPAPIST